MFRSGSVYSLQSLSHFFFTLWWALEVAFPAAQYLLKVAGGPIGLLGQIALEKLGHIARQAHTPCPSFIFEGFSQLIVDVET